MRRRRKRKRLRILLIPIIIIVIIIAIFHRSSKSIDVPDNAPKKVDSLLTSVNDDAIPSKFSGDVLIARRGEILFKKAYGKANYETNVPNTIETRFRIYSLTNMFTAAAVMKLQEEGKITTEDPLSKYVSGFPDGNKIKIHNLLNHSSGLWDFTSDPGYDKNKPLLVSMDKRIGELKQKELAFEPGSKSEYSASNYLLLSYIISKVTGKSCGTYIKNNITTPLNLKNTGFDSAQALIKNRASGYKDLDGNLSGTGYVEMDSLPGANMYSTVDDLFALDREFYNGKFLKNESLNSMFTPNSSGFGYGITIHERYGGHKCLESQCVFEGFQAEYLRFIDDDITVIVLSNSENEDSFKAMVQKLISIVTNQKIVNSDKK